MIVSLFLVELDEQNLNIPSKVSPVCSSLSQTVTSRQDSSNTFAVIDLKINGGSLKT